MKSFRLIGPITGISGDFADLDAVAVDVRNRGVIGNADQYLSLQHAFQLFPASLQCLGIRPDARDGRDVAIKRSVILDNLVASLAHGCPDIRGEHGSIISLTWSLRGSRRRDSGEFRKYHRDEKGRIVKKDDHLMDATRYWWVSGRDWLSHPPTKREDDMLERLRRGGMEGGGGPGSWMR